MTTTPDIRSIWLRRLMAWSVYALALSSTIKPIGVPFYDPDIWWHLGVGKWVWQHCTVPSTDPFSRLDTPWVAYSWLYEVLVFGLHSTLGLSGIIVYRATMALAIVAALDSLVRRLMPASFLAGTGLLAFVTFTLSPLFSERPWLATILFCTLTLRTVIEIHTASRPPWWIWLLPLVFVVWSNVHIQFIHGLFILGLASVTGPRRKIVFWLLFACLLATIANPFHILVYRVIIEYASQPGPYAVVQELQAMKFREPRDWLVLGYTVAAWWAVGRRDTGLFGLLLLAATTVFAFRSCRDVWLVLLAGIPIFAQLDWPTEPKQPSATLREWLIGVALLAALGLGLGYGRGLNQARLDATVQSVFPQAAAAYIRDNQLPGPLFNDFDWGGYCIWALPDHPVAIDGRTNLHGDERIQRFGRVWSGRPGWENDIDLCTAGVILAPVGQPLSSLLLSDPRFERVYHDDTAWVFVARGGR